MNVLSANQWGNLGGNWRASRAPKLNVLFSSPIPLSSIKNRSPVDVTWYSGGKPGRASQIIRLRWQCRFYRCNLIFLPKWFSDGRLTATASETFCTFAMTVSLGFSKLSHAFLLIFAFTLVVSHFVADEWGLWSLICSTKLSNSSSLTEARRASFLVSSHFYEVIPSARFF